MLLSELIVVDPEILADKPVIRGTRLAVEFILELFAAGQSESDVLTNYQSAVVMFRVHPATPMRLAPLVRAFVYANTAWSGHISIVTADGIQMLETRSK